MKPARHARRGFTLLELLLLLLLMGLLLSLVLVNTAALLPDPSRQSTPEQFWETVRRARERAVLEAQPMRLAWDGRQRAFTVTPDAEPPPLFEEDGEERDGDEATPPPARLLRERQDSFRLAFRRGTPVYEPLTHVVFKPDGTCTPFAVEFGPEGGERIRIDPWTCAPELPPAPAP